MEASLLRERQNAYSTSTIPVLYSESNSCKVPAESQLACDLRNVDLIIWDEAVMCLPYCIDAGSHRMQDLTRNCRRLGGKIFVFWRLEPNFSWNQRWVMCIVLSPVCQKVSTLQAVMYLSPYGKHANDSATK